MNFCSDENFVEICGGDVWVARSYNPWIHVAPVGCGRLFLNVWSIWRFKSSIASESKKSAMMTADANENHKQLQGISSNGLSVFNSAGVRAVTVSASRRGAASWA